MKITIENPNGQKYLMTGEEFVARVERSIIDSTGRKFTAHETKQFLRDFLFTYEEEPTQEGVRTEEDRCCISCYDVTAAPSKTHTAHSPYWKGCCTNPDCKCHSI